MESHSKVIDLIEDNQKLQARIHDLESKLSVAVANVERCQQALGRSGCHCHKQYECDCGMINRQYADATLDKINESRTPARESSG